jgi:hypothetical protein
MSDTNNGSQRIKSVVESIRNLDPMPPRQRIPFSPEPKNEPDDEGHRLRQLEEALGRVPLDDIALMVKALTFGEMIEYVESIRAADTEKLLPESVTNDHLAHIIYKCAVLKLKGSNNDRQEGNKDS